MQLSPGLVKGSTSYTTLDRLRFCRTHFNVSIRDAIAGGSGKLVVAYLSRQSGLARINGRLWLNRRLAVIYGHAEISTSGPALVESFEVDIERFPLFRALIENTKEPGAWVALLPAASSVARRLEHHIADALDLGHAFGCDSHRVQSLVAATFRAIEEALRPQHRASLAADRKSTVDAAQAYMWANMCGDIGLPAMSRAIGCSARTLSNYFESLYGMSPMRFMKVLRLNRVREILRDGPDDSAIVEIAADHGFWHMGHFAVQYRYLFGETASETVRNARTAAALVS